MYIIIVITHFKYALPHVHFNDDFDENNQESFLNYC